MATLPEIIWIEISEVPRDSLITYVNRMLGTWDWEFAGHCPSVNDYLNACVALTHVGAGNYIWGTVHNKKSPHVVMYERGSPMTRVIVVRTKEKLQGVKAPTWWNAYCKKKEKKGYLASPKQVSAPVAPAKTKKKAPKPPTRWSRLIAGDGDDLPDTVSEWGPPAEED